MLGLHVLRLLQALALVATATAEGGRITIRPGGSMIVAGGQAADGTSNDTSGASSAELEALKSRVASLEAAQTTAQAAQENAQTTIDALSEQYHLLKREIEALKNITEGLIPPPAFPPPPSPPSCLNGGLTLHNPTWTSNINNAAGCMSPAGCMIRAIPAVETTSFGSACVYTLNAAEVVDTGVTASAAAMRTIAFWAHITKDDYGGYGEMVAKSVSNQGKEVCAIRFPPPLSRPNLDRSDAPMPWIVSLLADPGERQQDQVLRHGRRGDLRRVGARLRRTLVSCGMRARRECGCVHIVH